LHIISITYYFHKITFGADKAVKEMDLVLNRQEGSRAFGQTLAGMGATKLHPIQQKQILIG